MEVHNKQTPPAQSSIKAVTKITTLLIIRFKVSVGEFEMSSKKAASEPNAKDCSFCGGTKAALCCRTCSRCGIT
jgi:hypothetical protein